jgi:hypothetical protein
MFPTVVSGRQAVSTIDGLLQACSLVRNAASATQQDAYADLSCMMRPSRCHPVVGVFLL